MAVFLKKKWYMFALLSIRSPNIIGNFLVVAVLQNPKLNDCFQEKELSANQAAPDFIINFLLHLSEVPLI